MVANAILSLVLIDPGFVSKIIFPMKFTHFVFVLNVIVLVGLAHFSFVPNVIATEIFFDPVLVLNVVISLRSIYLVVVL